MVSLAQVFLPRAIDHRATPGNSRPYLGPSTVPGTCIRGTRYCTVVGPTVSSGVDTSQRMHALRVVGPYVLGVPGSAAPENLNVYHSLVPGSLL